MPQNPGLKIPTPPPGQLSQRISIFNATLLPLKHDVCSVDTVTDALSPITPHGSISFASNPDFFVMSKESKFDELSTTLESKVSWFYLYCWQVLPKAHQHPHCWFPVNHWIILFYYIKWMWSVWHWSWILLRTSKDTPNMVSDILRAFATLPSTRSVAAVSPSRWRARHWWTLQKLIKRQSLATILNILWLPICSLLSKSTIQNKLILDKFLSHYNKSGST